jgi:hypothetical protein
MKGWRTIIFAMGVATVGVLEATQWSDMVPDGPAKGWALLGISIGIAWLRVLTTTPIGQNE